IPSLILLTSSVLANPAPSAEELARAPIDVAIRDAVNHTTEAEPAAVDKRACTCQKVDNAGLYCGYCWAVKTGYVNGNVYWCNKQGGCDDLGRRTSCVNRNGPCDGRDS
ncbi:hypothetical protein CC86DRAFT_256140, partial [Ophiobolus disseminans]